VVVAEGIETPEQLSVVRRLGIAAGQGYLLAHPADEPKLDAADLDSLEHVRHDQEWVDPRLVAIGLAEAPGDRPPDPPAPDSDTHVPAPPVPAPEATRPPRRRKRRATPLPEEAAPGVS
jgi:hypothetical protein